ncbi:radical SAM protein [bacterium]|nr:radical SAM protein [bacterium]
MAAASAIRAYISFVTRRATPLAMPVHYHLDATNRCNLRCAYCPYSENEVPSGGWGDMDIALCDRILEQLKNKPPAMGVSLHLGGEPLLHPEFDALVALVHAHLGRRPMVASNGTALTPSMIERVKSAGGAAFEIDFSSKRDVFERLRVGADWETTRSNISNALDAGLTVFLFALDGDADGLRDLFAARPNLAVSRFRMHNVGGDFAPLVERRFGLQREQSRFHPCTHPWFGMAVAWNGKVVVCCRDVLHKHVVGDLTRETVEDVWMGRAFKRLRTLHASGELESLPLCKTCDRPFEPLNHPWRVFLMYSPIARLVDVPRPYRPFDLPGASRDHA